MLISKRQHSIQLLAQQLQQHQAQLEQAERPAQQRPAQPSLNEPMRVAVPQHVVIGTKPCPSDLPPTKPNSPDPTWAQLPTMEVLPAAAMSEQADPNFVAALGAQTGAAL